ncbi:MAG: Trk family potassium uptake protein [Chloroflexi bacterium]|nr:Trk family potassium uptake protein [Chloroflexota bacterium]
MMGWLRRRRGDVIIRSPGWQKVQRVHARQRKARLPFSATTTFLLTGGFAILIGGGTVLLWLPIASTQSGAAPLLTALFTATSAVCVTGLVVVDSATYWTGFGQSVLAGLMYLGGLGIMTAGTILLVVIGRHLTLPGRIVMKESVGATTLGSVTSIIKRVLFLATAIQIVGSLVLLARLITVFSTGEAIWYSVFHAISGFNNAGFVIFPDSDSLIGLRLDRFIIVTIGTLVLLGALSFSVIAELARRQRMSRWSLDTRLVLVGSLVLSLLGAMALFFIEQGNPATLGDVDRIDQISDSFFQSIAARTAGFSTVDFGATRMPTNLVFMLLMFIGGASGSTAGGVKVNTMMVLLAAAVTSLRGRPHPEIFRRELAYEQVARAITLVLLVALTLLTFLLALMITERQSIDSGQFLFIDLLFESVSALGTTGLSTGITSDLTTGGKLLITALMYVGRLGPLTIVLGLALREHRAVYRYAQETVRIG